MRRLFLLLLLNASFLAVSAHVAAQDEEGNEQHEYVDLGLSVKWATYNLGATDASGYGDYYSWGELSAKDDYSESNYIYFIDGQYKNIGASICNTKYDAAKAQWGEGWRLPSLVDINQLTKQCTWTADTLNGIAGYTVTGPNGNSIFLPKAGMQADTAPTEVGTKMYYWCGMSSSATATSAYVLNDSGYSGTWSASRAYGFPIRPVCVKTDEKEDEGGDTDAVCSLQVSGTKSVVRDLSGRVMLHPRKGVCIVNRRIVVR